MDEEMVQCPACLHNEMVWMHFVCDDCWYKYDMANMDRDEKCKLIKKLHVTTLLEKALEET